MGTIFGISSSLISSAFGALSGFFFKLRSQNLEVQAAERKHNMEMLVAVANANTQARKDEVALLKAKADYEERLSKSDPHRSIARRVLAYGLMFGLVFMLPYLVVFKGVTWFEIREWTQTTSGFLIFPGSTKQVVETITATGLPLAWLYGMLDVFAGIIAFYFGGSLAKFRNPYVK